VEVTPGKLGRVAATGGGCGAAPLSFGAGGIKSFRRGWGLLERKLAGARRTLRLVPDVAFFGRLLVKKPLRLHPRDTKTHSSRCISY